MASRSATIKIINNSSSELIRKSSNLDHGIWSTNFLPAEVIKPKQEHTFQAESDGFMTGTEGIVKYKKNDEVIEIYFDVPFKGDNEITVTPNYEKSPENVQGNNPSVIIEIVD